MFQRIRRALSALFERVSGGLANKLILLFSSIIILVVVSLTMISYMMLQQESSKHIIESTSNNLMLVNKNMEDYLSRMESLSLPQTEYDELTYSIMHESSDYASRMYLEDFLRNLFFSRDDIEAIVMYMTGTRGYYYLTKENNDIIVRKGAEADIEHLSWYKEAMDSSHNRSYQSLIVPDAEVGYPVQVGQSFMAYHRVYRSIVTREPQAVLSLYFNSSVIDEIVKDVPFQDGQHLLFLSPRQMPFYADDMTFYNELNREGIWEELQNAESGRLTWNNGAQRYLIIHDSGQQEGWKLVKPVPYDQIYESARQTRNFSLVIGAIFLVVGVVLVSLLTRAITKPLIHLSQQMNRFSKGDFDTRAAVKGRDEVTLLSRHFNQMVERTNQWINERYKLKLAQKNAMLKALESEINPHFLYNALQAISTKALKHNNLDIADMVDALALTLRYCISGKEMVLARDELQHIERYLSIQKARFGSRLNVQYDWDPSLLELSIPKLSIQTLVENSIKHGLERVSEEVEILILSERNEQHALITVRDNGKGFTAEQLEEVIRSFHHEWDERDGHGGIGLVNLNARLKLRYGEAAGLTIRSDSGSTDVTMIIPMGGTGNVQAVND
ncbi:sensor histidine kinase [Marinicrinis lubricantis]|uniref:Sensor histidine kinase n=1 Tax=Marinicrinis lubricantis TaxID=2086470 RepID=A0ABW1IPK9_9BACL